MFENSAVRCISGFVANSKKSRQQMAAGWRSLSNSDLPEPDQSGFCAGDIIPAGQLI
jgi:hypothetical protein